MLFELMGLYVEKALLLEGFDAIKWLIRNSELNREIGSLPPKLGGLASSLQIK